MRDFTPVQQDKHARKQDKLLQKSSLIMTYFQEMLINALTFRNKHASRPYLPEELIPACHKKVLIASFN